MVNPVSNDIHDDIGLAWNAVNGTTTTIVGNLIKRAQNDCKRITGTTSGDTRDAIVRYLADAYTMNNVLANLDPSVNSDLYLEMRNEFMNQANLALRSIGKALDGYTIKFVQVNP